MILRETDSDEGIMKVNDRFEGNTRYIGDRQPNSSACHLSLFW